MNRTSLHTLLVIQSGASIPACDGDQPSPTLAPSASSLAPSQPATAAAQRLTIDGPSSKVEFTMEAPKEKIHGRVLGAATGEIQVDPTDVTKTTGLVAVDIGGIELLQDVADE